MAVTLLPQLITAHFTGSACDMGSLGKDSREPRTVPCDLLTGTEGLANLVLDDRLSVTVRMGPTAREWLSVTVRMDPTAREPVNHFCYYVSMT